MPVFAAFYSIAIGFLGASAQRGLNPDSVRRARGAAQSAQSSRGAGGSAPGHGRRACGPAAIPSFTCFSRITVSGCRESVRGGSHA